MTIEMIWILLILTPLSLLAMLYFIIENIYYHNKIDKLEKRIEVLENDKQ